MILKFSIAPLPYLLVPNRGCLKVSLYFLCLPFFNKINSLLLDGIRTLVHLLPGKLSFFILSRDVTQLFFFLFSFFSPS